MFVFFFVFVFFLFVFCFSTLLILLFFNKSGRTPLYCAIEYKAEDLVLFLVAKGGDMNATDNVCISYK